MFKTIKKIAKHVSCVQEAMLHVVDELRQRAFVHDASKFEEDELEYYAAYERFPKGLEYGSKEYKEAEKRLNVGIGSPGFSFHTSRNDHHPEHWDCPENGSDIGFMGLFPLIEMTCDWAGAHLAYGNKGNWHESVRHNINRYDFDDKQKWVIDQMASFLANRIPELREQG